MDTATIEKQGHRAHPALVGDDCASSRARSEIPALLAELENQGTPDGFFDFGVGMDDKDSSKQIAELYQGGISLPDRDYYIVDNTHFAEIRAAVHRAHEEDVHAGRRHARSGRQGSRRGDGDRDGDGQGLHEPHRPAPSRRIATTSTPIADLDKLTPDFDWSVYFHAVGIGHFDTLNVATPDFFKALNGLLQSEPLDSWKSYLRWQVLHGQAQNLPKAFFDENFAFFSKTLSGQEEPQRALEAVLQPDRQRAGRSRRPGLGEAELSARRQREHGQAGGCARKVAGRRHQDAALDERRHQEGRRSKSWP